MKLYIYKIKEELKRKSADVWYFLMKPIAYFFTTEKINARYNKKREKITEDQAIRWIAEDIVRYLIKYKFNIDILICDYASQDDFWTDCTLRYGYPYYIKRKKTQMAFHKFKMDIEFQEKIIEQVKTFTMIEVIEKIENYTWQRINNYKKTVIIKLK
jgi:hypothetical protein